MDANSKQILSNQDGVHPNLEKTALRHLNSVFRKPVSKHTQAAFDVVSEAMTSSARPLILDSCCGVGDSSRVLARAYPSHWIVGVDKSGARLGREREEANPENLRLVRADLNDFFRLAANAGWRPERHYILYPNPWPKAEHLKRRWHGAPVFPDIIWLGGRLELRSNWRLYLEEFALALKLAGHTARVQAFDAKEPITPFEAKYKKSGQPLWQLTAVLS
ncbi:tRNA (guanine(46)-N(7))-methyltransferase TrmB [Kordiimonas sp.]|uniref:tRNA (guanine(46)-N(7))-methyltransferase TrmB n=1 Tax=Kordiimonas sp. TaxID=1970157 RepID=UPI003A8FD818